MAVTQKPARWVLCLTIVVIVLSPLLYYGTGIGQKASMLNRESSVSTNGVVHNSPKSEALHSLKLPLEIEQILIYPLVMLLVHFSGMAVSLRTWLDGRWAPLLRKMPGFQLLNHFLQRLTKNRLTLVDVTGTALYIGLFTLAATLVYFPWSYYQGFVLPTQFGLLTQTPQTWLRDFSVGAVIRLAAAVVLLTLAYGLLKLLPRRWPLVVGTLFTVLLVGYTVLEPLVITPMSYEITPAADPDLRSRVQLIAERAGVTFDDVYIIHTSEKNPAGGSAYFAGLGQTSRIMIPDTRLTDYRPAEMEFTIAHEMGHWLYRHALIGTLGMIVILWAALFALRWWIERSWQGLGWNGPADVAGYPYLLGLLSLIGVLALPALNNAYRLAEIQTDEFALSVVSQPDAAATLLKRLADENLIIMKVSPLEEYLWLDHPPTGSRIERALEKAREPGNGLP